jgi:RNA polymerase sigma-70 factor (ECF subfamily)
VSLLTDDAWPTMPPEPYAYQEQAAIAEFLRDAKAVAARTVRLVPTRANGQPAFGCHLPDAHAEIARVYGLMVLTLEGDRISAITWFDSPGVFTHFGLPRALPE